MGPRPIEVPGMWVVDEFLPDTRALFTLLTGTTAWDERMRARKTASFGVPYNYSGITYPVAPVPEPVAALMDRLADRLGYRLNNCLANYYTDGESAMGFHSDSTDGLAPATGIAIVSLGAERSITFQAKANKLHIAEFSLRSGSLLYMTAEVQNDWKHAILPQRGATGRISLTFRNVKCD
ncbi:MAG: alpha-ketoglutarate-dependent dioxygenase AlkB [Planctomycetaceae bacterium]|nr:alpha-ketoglutarate-dependent dioxygenase AlkB [Planctomycetaceae bacterium]